jgi:iron(III) transport system substrate-binding protein
MAAYMARNGEPALTELLTAMAANEPRIYPKNAPIVEAVIAGEIDWGLVNHYYLLRALAEQPDAAAENYYMPGDDGSTFLNLAGVGLLRESLPGRLFVGFLLSDESQRFFAEETFEFALAGEAADPETLRLAAGVDAAIDFGSVSDSLERTLTLIQDSGLNRFR